MKIAVCFSGQIRTGVHAAENILNFLDIKKNNIDFFIHTWDISIKKEWHFNSIISKRGQKEKYLHTESGYLLLEKLNQHYNFKSVEIENFKDFSNLYLSQFINFSPQWYSWYKSVQLKKKYEELGNFKYDIVIRMRPDIIYPKRKKLDNEISHYLNDKEKFYVIGYSPIRIDDVFFYSNSKNMDTASEMMIKTKNKNWTNNHFGEYLKNVGITALNAFDLNYTVLRHEALTGTYHDYSFCRMIDNYYYSDSGNV